MAGTRPIHPLPGMEGWTCARQNYPLPDGMPDRARCRIVDQPEPQRLVVEVDGQCWEVPWWNIEIGEEYQTSSGKWIREPDERVRRYVQKRLAWARGLSPRIPERDKSYWEDHYEWILRRNGWEVPKRPA
ncbi:hypothetical protein OJ996_20545 [Luteolibacter sp. GHJ8]|uniref:Uncharacterized protein n=1 Tax=Luteolibacter rhizosphaerae TaxID=2989719 RepID=A0ABT3G940_9BACT|nr:hypothetical protein [Luteolibacter rhizosphaerae]